MQAQGIQETALQTISTIGQGLKTAVYWSGHRIIDLKDAIAAADIPGKIVSLVSFIFTQLSAFASWSIDKLSILGGFSWESAKAAGSWGYQTAASLATSIFTNGRAVTGWTLEQGKVVVQSGSSAAGDVAAFMFTTNPGLAVIAAGVGATALAAKEWELLGNSPYATVGLYAVALTAAAFVGSVIL